MAASTLALVSGSAVAGCGSDDSGACDDASECASNGGEGGAPEPGSAGSGGAGTGGGMAGDGGGDGAGAGGRGPEPCDRASSPSSDACSVDEAVAVFVAPDGDDGADGTRDEPVQTLARAIALARVDDKMVIACAATFDERLVLGDAVRLHGGFVCPSDASAANGAAWTYTGAKTVLAPSTSGVVFEARDVASAIVVEDFEFRARDGSERGESSVAAFVVRAGDLTLRRVRLVAGDGMDGADAETAGHVYPSAAALRGSDGSALFGGAEGTCVGCAGEVISRRGHGGNPPAEEGGRGLPRWDDEDDPSDAGKGGASDAVCAAGGDGVPGASGFFGSSPAGAGSFGSLTAEGWLASFGADAPDGFPGQAGGGGAGKPGGGGGSGGCGGCGGKGGSGGQGGGASIGLAAIDSSLTVEGSEIVTGPAGDGGAGSAGQPGQTATGIGGDGFGSGLDRGCAGGNGGPGGNGGNGSGGAGGLSVGILFAGDTTIVEAGTEIAPGVAGVGGLGGGLAGEAGIDGVAVERLETP